MRDNALYYKYMLMEYLQLMILDYLSATPYVRKVTFIGGTCLRLVKGIDRFSEDLDFDCKEFSRQDFREMTDGILQFIRRSGLNAVVKDRDNPKLTAFRRSFYFPGLLFELGLTGHREERILVKVESQDQQVQYQSVIADIKGCGFFFPMPVPPDGVLCGMKVGAMLERQKGRDFYDAMFLLSQTRPDYGFLAQKTGIANLASLKEAVVKTIETVDLATKMRDFEHLLINKSNSARILRVGEFLESL